MRIARVDPRIGSQIWLERGDTRARVDALLDKAMDLGIGTVRTFLMWPWIQAESRDAWDFALFDSLFDSAAARGIRIKATLTANSGPWWLGTPSVLHSHTLILESRWWSDISEYVTRCADRYADHPALAQWILWNEPLNLGPFAAGSPERPEDSTHEWESTLRSIYSDDIGALNKRWRTGFEDFVNLPFVENLAHDAHARWFWRSYGPELDDYQFRAMQLVNQLRRIAGLVRGSDPKTPLCINPNQTFSNHAEVGYDLAALAGVVDILGASFHAPWHFTFANADDHSSLVVAGLSLLRNSSPNQSAEVTEVQTGNTMYAGATAMSVGPPDIAITYLAPILAGAESVTGWCFNTRGQDFEAGEWGLLDDLDEPGPRAKAVTRVVDALAELDSRLGPWSPEPSDCTVLLSEKSQAVQMAIAEHSVNAYGKQADGTAQGSALITVELARQGVRSSLATISSLGALPEPRLIIAAGMTAWDPDTPARLLALAFEGATLLYDGTTGRFNLDAELHRPWPGGLAGEVGLRSAGLETGKGSEGVVQVNLLGSKLGDVVDVRGTPIFSTDVWAGIPNLTFAQDGEPVAWARSWGRGRLLYCTIPLAMTLLGPGDRSVANYILGIAASECDVLAKPLSPSTTVFPVRGGNTSAIGIFAPCQSERSAEIIAVQLPIGRYYDIWNQSWSDVGLDGIFRSVSPDGICLLVPED